MRQLRFRIWNGTEMEYNVTVGKFGAFYVNPMSKGDGLDEKDAASLTPFNTKYPDETPVMQFIGLHDKDGKEIYDGDILRDTLTQITYVVKFGYCKRYGFTGWYCEGEDGYQSTLNGDYGGQQNDFIEVIGNIYEPQNQPS